MGFNQKTQQVSQHLRLGLDFCRNLNNSTSWTHPLVIIWWYAPPKTQKCVRIFVLRTSFTGANMKYA